ncbi:MAG: maltose alpha-D-glucosyltransferase [Bacteroidota bacterium]
MPLTYRRQPLWFKDAIIYELNIKGFFDANNDGIGDFDGLCQQLDYIEELGVTAIWILPFYPSPLRDDGYDIADYYTISSAYGKLEDFKRFLDEAHARNLQVITELVINHTSDQHPWFQRARKAPKDSPERNFYVWSDNDDKYPDVRIIFTDTETSNWTWDPVAQQYYWHRFFSHQPDLNYDNPQVQEEIFKILDYWMDMGIDGFRLDAIPYLFEREGTNGENLPETHEFLKKLRRHVDEKYDNVLFLAEANMWPEDSASYFGDGDECHMNYHFPLMPRMYMSIKMEDRHPITDIFDQTPEIPENCQWATFLRNHDELTLEMVTDEERDFMYKVYASDKTARINLGIRRRLAPLMDNDRNKIELLNVLLMSLPGTPVIYYGDEIGMGDNYYLGDRDGVRTPMQWNNNENAGFSAANPHSLYLPVIRDTEYSYRWINVRRQQSNPNSLLNWTRRLLAKRKEFQVFGRGNIKFLQPENSRVLAFVREYEDETVVVIINLSRHPQSVKLDLCDFQGRQVREVFGRNYFPEIGKDDYPITIGAYGYYWLQVEPAGPSPSDIRKLHKVELSAEDASQLFNKSNLRAMERSLLPNYLKSVSWFGPASEQLEQVTIEDYRMQPYGERHFGWVLLSVRYQEKLPELIQLPIAIHHYREDTDYGHDEQYIGRIDLGSQQGILMDALYDDAFLRFLMSGLQEFSQVPGFQLEKAEAFRQMSDQDLQIEHPGPEYMLLRSRDLRVKYLRRLDPHGNVPDVEIKNLLNQRGYGSAPTIVMEQTFEYKKQHLSLVVFEQREAIEDNAWNYIINQFRNLANDLLNYRGEASTEHPEDVALTDAMVFRDMPELIQELLNSPFVVRIAEIGRGIAALHLLFAEVDQEDFGVEQLSLHYQRSLFAGLKGQVRATFQLLQKRADSLGESHSQLVNDLLDRRPEVEEKLKRVFAHKIESDKVRLHGDLTLEQIDLKGEGFVIRNFDGDPDSSYSQRRLRRSPAKDLANLIRSFNYAAGLILDEFSHEPERRYNYLSEWLDTACQCLSAEMLTAYRKAIPENSRLLPGDENDLNVLLDTFLIEKTMQEIRYDLNARPGQAHIPLMGLKKLLQ